MATVGIYALCDKEGIRYIGQSNNIEKRYSQHCSINQNRGCTKKNKWVNELHKIGAKPNLLVLELTDDLDSKEIEWIERYKDLNLLNMSDGGKTTSYLNRAKKSKLWGNTHSPVQSRTICISRTIKYLKENNFNDSANRLQAKLNRINELVSEVGLDNLNNLLWSKYGN